MKTKSIMKRSTFTKRRKIIIYMIAMILILGVVAGFTDPFITDNTIHKARFGEIIVMEKETPESGSPEDYDLISNLQFAAYKLHHASYFRAVTSGKTVADIGFTTYTQNVNNIRVSDGNGVVFAETISSSSLKSVAEQKYADNGIIIFRNSKSISGNSATFENTASIMSYDSYANNYGTIPDQLSKYIVNEKTIIFAKDENAKAQPAAKAQSGDNQSSEEAADSGFDFYVPEKLEPNADGNYVFTLKLDETASSLYYRNEVRTLAGADQNPKFYSVTLTITIDKEWNPISVRTVENYDIAIPVLGAMNCTGTLTEYFTQINDPEGEVPERDFFQPYVDKAKEEGYVPPEPVDNKKPTSPADYLAAAFADYISGEKNLELAADISVGDLSAYDLTLSLDLGTMATEVMLGDLYVKYDGNKVNLKLNDINGYMSIADFNALMQNENVKSLTSKFDGIDFDVMSIFGGDMLGTVFADCEMTSEGGVTRIHMPFTLDLSALDIGIDSAFIDASIYIEDEGLKLKSITGEITLGGKTIEVEATPLTFSPVFPSTEGAVDLSGALDLVPDLLATAMQTTYGVSGNVTAMGQTFDVTAYVDRTDGVKADMIITAMGLDISVKYADGIVYVSLGNIDARGTVEELPTLMSAILDVTDLDTYVKLIKRLMPETINEFVSMIKSLEVNDSTVTLGLDFLTSPVTIGLKHENNSLSGITFDMSFNKFGLALDAAADLNVFTPEAREISFPSGDEYVTFTQLAELITSISPYLGDNACYDISLGGNVSVGDKEYNIGGDFAIDRLTSDNLSTLSANGILTVLGQTAYVTYTNDTTYFDISGIKAKLASADVEKLQTPIMRIINLFADIDSIDVSEKMSDAVGMIKSLAIDDDGILHIIVTVKDSEISITLNPTTGEATVFGYVDDVKLDLTLSVAVVETAHGIAVPENAESYIDAIKLDTTINSVADILESKSLSADALITYNNDNYGASVKLSFEDGLKINMTADEFKLDVTVSDGKAFITFGDVKLVGEMSDINTALEAFADVIPSEVMNTITDMMGIFDRLPEIESIVDTALTSITSLTVEDGAIKASISYNDVTADINITLSLDSVYVNVYGADLAVQFELNGISSAPVTIETPDEASYAKASDLIAAASPVVPLANERYFDIAVNAEISGVAVTGSVYIDLADGTLNNIQLEANLTAGDIPVKAVVVNKIMYLSVGSTINLSMPITENDVMALVDKLDYAIAGLKDKVITIIECIKALSVEGIINSVALVPAENGFTASVDLTDSGLALTAAATMVVNNGTLGALDIDISLFGISLKMSMNATVNDGVLTALNGTAACGDIALGLGLGISPTSERSVQPIEDCVPIADVTEYIKPVLDLIDSTTGMKSAVIDLGAFALTEDNVQTKVAGTLQLSFTADGSIAAELELTLFHETENAEKLLIKFVDSVLYITSGNIMLSLDTDADLQRLYNVLSGYLPEYLSDEIAKLFKLQEGASIFSEITQIVERIEEIADAKSMDEVISLLFSPLSGLSGDSAIKTMLDMVNIFERDGKLVIGLNTLGMTFNITPNVANEKLDSATLDTTIELLDNLYVRLNVTGFEFSDAELTITAPENASEYVSLVEFVETVNNAVNTLTATDEDGNITFELKTFKYDYEIFAIETYIDEDGNTVNVKDNAGRDKPKTDENGNKVVDKEIHIKNNPDKSAVKAKFIKTETTDENGEVKTSYKLNLEAHIVIEITAQVTDMLTRSSPITLDLYAIDNDEYSGLAFIDYLEGSGNGERISIDYNSVMEIVAAVMDILSVDDDTMDLLLGDYRVKVDKKVFESMAIVGIDSIRDTLNNLADAVQTAKDAMADIKKAWNEIAEAGDVDTLSERIDEIKDSLESGMEKASKAMAQLSGKDISKDKETETPELTQLNGKLYGDIVNGVTFKKDATHIWATIENEITTNTSGVASVVVTQSNDTIDSITVGGLDVNTAKLDNFTTVFTAGEKIEINLPDDYGKTVGNSTYSDFANIKHLLFDVMNTANMLEFEIGDINKANSDNQISMVITTGVYNVNLNIKYSAKIEIIDQGVGANPRFKTAAVIELNLDQVKGQVIAFIPAGIIMPKCVTRLYFYDDVIYIRGVKSWKESWGSVKNMEYIDTCYTIDDLSDKLSAENGILQFMNEFVYYLLPLSSTVQDVINKAIETETSDKNRTFAQVFKGYAYTVDDNLVGTHGLTIGLKELAGISVLSDADISIIGKNDGDDNILDNYVHKLHVGTNVVGSMVKLNIYGTLRNVAEYTENNVNKIKSGGLSNTIEGETLRHVINTRIPNTAWSRIWA